MNKIIITIVVVVIVALGGYFIYNNGVQKSALSVYQQPNEQAVSQQTVEQTPTENTPTPEPIIENIIIYTDSGYSPNSITIKNGETVTFKNQSSNSMWPASAMHPSHRLYGGTSLDEHCPDKINSAFDACIGILLGNSWSFKFDKTGSWKYHDHLSPSNFGTIIVK